MTKTANTKVRAPKAGSARSNQSVKIAGAKVPTAPAKAPKPSDKISSVKNDTSGRFVCVTAPGNETLTYPRETEPKALKALAVVGGSYKAVARFLKENPPAKPQAKLARGVDSHNAPHSAKAIADQKAPATAKGKQRAVKADKAKAPSRGGNRAYTKGPTANTAREGTFRHYFIETLLAHKDEDSAKAAHAKSKQYADTKFNFNWAAAQGYIVWK